METGKDIVLHYCKNLQTGDVEHLQDSIDNLQDIENGNYLKDGYELSGCPSNFGLESWDGLCFEEEVEGYREQCEQCRECWIMALDKSK